MGFFDRFKKNNNVETRNGLNKIYFDDGKSDQIKISFNSKDGNKDGLYEEFSKEGNLITRLNYQKGKKYGLCEEYSLEGSLSVRLNFKDGKSDGLYEKFYSSGQLEYKGEYLDNKKVGLWTDYYKNGNIKKEEVFKDGLKNSIKEWDEKGTLAQDSKWENPYDSSVDIDMEDESFKMQYFYPNGNLKDARIKEVGKSGVTIKIYRNDGTKSFNGQYQIIKNTTSDRSESNNPNLNELYKADAFEYYWVDSDIKSKEFYKPIGVWKAYNENGDLLYELDFEILKSLNYIGEKVNPDLYVKTNFDSKGKKTSSVVYKQYFFSDSILKRDESSLIDPKDIPEFSFDDLPELKLDSVHDGVLPALDYIFDGGYPLSSQFKGSSKCLESFFINEEPLTYEFNTKACAYRLVNEFLLSHGGFDSYNFEESQERWTSKDYEINIYDFTVQIENLKPSALNDKILEKMEMLLHKLFLKAGQTINICSASGGWPLEKIEESLKKAITFRDDFHTFIEREFYFWKYPQEKLNNRIDDDNFKSLCTKEKVSDNEGFVNFLTDIGGYNPSLDNGGKWWQRMIHILGKDAYASGLGQLKIYEQERDPEMIAIAIKQFESALDKNIPEAKKELDRLKAIYPTYF